MFENILTKDSVSFKDLEEIAFKIACEFANEILRNILEEFDKKISQKNHINESNRNAYDRELADYHAEIQSGKIIYAISKAVNGNNIEEFKLDFPVSIRSKILLLEEIKNSTTSNVS